DERAVAACELGFFGRRLLLLVQQTREDDGPQATARYAGERKGVVRKAGITVLAKREQSRGPIRRTYAAARGGDEVHRIRLFRAHDLVAPGGEPSAGVSANRIAQTAPGECRDVRLRHRTILHRRRRDGASGRSRARIERAHDVIVVERTEGERGEEQ